MGRRTEWSGRGHRGVMMGMAKPVSEGDLRLCRFASEGYEAKGDEVTEGGAFGGGWLRAILDALQYCT